MRSLITVSLVGLLAVGAFSVEVISAKGAQRPQPLPTTPQETTTPPDTQPPPETQPPSEKTPPRTPPTPGLSRPNTFRPRNRPTVFPSPRPLFRPGVIQPPPRVTQPAPPSVTQPTPPAVPARPLQSVFLIPSGLSMPPEDLFLDLGYDPQTCIPLTPQTSFDIAYRCYARGLFRDALAFARHGLTMCDDARLQLLKGVCELHLGRCAEVEKTAGDFRAAIAQQQLFGLEVAQERINDPMSVRFDAIVEYQNTGR
jgi:hypothetical protein